MAQILNDRDKALQAAPYRSVIDSVTISGTASAFLASKNTVTILPATITLTATPSGSSYGPLAVYTWSYATSAQPNTWIQLSSGANLKTQVLNNTDSWVTNPFVTYRCVVTEALLDTSYAFYQVSFTREASDPVVINLTRNNVLVTCDASGKALTPITNTDQVITVNRGTLALTYSSNTTTPNSFTVGTPTAVKLSPGTITTTTTEWKQGNISDITDDGATITYPITVYDSATPPAATSYTKTVVYNKVSNGVIGANGADGANLNPIVNYDFAGATLPTGFTFLGTITSTDYATTTTIQNDVVDRNLILSNLDLLPVNSYIISMRVKFIPGATGTWEGRLLYKSTTHTAYDTTPIYYKTIPQPAQDVWTTINLDMRSLTVGGNDFMSGGNIKELRFDFINDTVSQVSIDYISICKYGVAEATKSVTASMYVWAPPTQSLTFTQPFTYTWNGGTVDYYPVAYTDTLVTPSVVRSWTSTAGSAPGNGYVLYQRNITITDIKSAVTTTNLNWSNSSVNTIGYRTDGSIGPQGDSARVAYVVTTGVWTNPTSPASNGVLAPAPAITISATTAGTNVATISTSLPVAVGTKITLTSGTGFGNLGLGIYYVKSFISATQVTLSNTADLASTLVLATATGSLVGTTNSWSFTATANLADGQYMYQSDGLLNSNQQTPAITWGVPYLSNLKVGSLSAISANLGSVKVASGGALYTDGKTFSGTTTAGFFLGDDGGTQKFKVGNAAGNAGLSWDGSTLVANALEIKDASGTTVITANTKATEIFNNQIKVGGTNLLKNSTKVNFGTVLSGTAVITLESGTLLDGSTASLIKIVTGTTAGAIRIPNCIRGNNTYSFGVYHKVLSGTATTAVDTCDANTGNLNHTANWQYTVFESIVVTNYTYDTYNFIDLNYPANATIYLYHPKVEYGSKATDWNYALEDTQANIDAWVLQKYNITTAAYTAPTYNVINTGQIVQTTYVPSTTTVFTWSDDNYIGLAGCTIYSSAAWTWTVNISHDDNAVIYINGAQVYNQALISTPTSRTLSIPAGWCTIELLWAEQAGADHFTLGQAISARPEVKAMKATLDFSGQTAAASTTSSWTGVSGSGKPEDNATVGATAANLKVGTGNNLCVNSDFNSIANWTKEDVTVTTTYGVNYDVNTTLNKGNGDGTGTLWVWQNSTTTTGYTDIASDPVVVIPGNTYFLSGYTGALRCIVTLFVYYFKIDGTLCTTQNSAGTINDAAMSGGTLLSGYYRHKEKIVPPTDCAYVKVILRKGPTKASAANSWMYVTRAMFEETGAAATEPGNWCAPGAGKTVTSAITLAQTTADSKLNRSANDILSGKISMAVTDAIYTGNATNGLFLGSQGITALSNGSPTFSIDATTGSAVFKGNLTGASGSFGGTLEAGVLDFTKLAGVSITCTASRVIQVPSDKTSMRVTLVGGGGGGGGGNHRFEMLSYTSQGGGGGGVVFAVTYTGLTPGAYYYVTIGAGGIRGTPRDGAYYNQTEGSGTPGGDGGSTFINPGQTSNFATAIAVATGGKGGSKSDNPVPTGGAAGTPVNANTVYVVTPGTYGPSYIVTQEQGDRPSQTITVYNQNLSGGAGGKNIFSTGGTSPNWYTPGTPPTGYGGGGYGGAGGLYTDNNYTLEAPAVAGTAGYALIEFFNPSMVVLQTDFNILTTALKQQNIRVS